MRGEVNEIMWDEQNHVGSTVFASCFKHGYTDNYTQQ